MIFAEEGIRGFWKGHVPGQILSITYGFGRFLAYDQFNEYSKTFGFFEKNSYPGLRHFIAGGFAGSFGMFMATPFDVVRTRIIAQDSNKGYHSMFGAFKSILQKEGPRGLFRGLVPSLVAIAPNSAIQFGSYNIMLNKYSDITSEEPSRSAVLLAGMSSGIIAKTIVYPLDLSKKRLQIQNFQENRTRFGKNISTTGLFDCLRKTFIEEGFSGLYKGLPSAIIKSGAMSGLFFFFYEEISKFAETRPTASL